MKITTGNAIFMLSSIESSWFTFGCRAGQDYDGVSSVETWNLERKDDEMKTSKCSCVENYTGRKDDKCPYFG